MNRFHRFVAAVALAVLAAAPAHADPVKCQKTFLGQLRKFKKVYLKTMEKCLDSENIGKIPGPCVASSQVKIQDTNQIVADKIAAACSMADIGALGFPANCAFEAAATQGVEAQCGALPVSTPTEFAECLKCWKAAELGEFLAILYASHAHETCGSLGETSAACSDLDCATPLPDQRKLGDTGENDCQKAIGKAGVKYLLSREKTLEKCALDGGTSTTCHADADLQLKITKAQTKTSTVIHDKCGNRDPLPNQPFCCKTTGNNCVAAPDRDSCETGGGQVQEGKVCGMSNTCDPVGGGNQKITWWDFCTSKWCPSFSVTTLDDLIDCVDARADEIVDSMLCYQFPAGSDGWLCPGSPSGAFVD